jgi:hypothetical protein
VEFVKWVGEEAEGYRVRERGSTFISVIECVASLTTAKFPFPMTLSNWYRPTWEDEDWPLLDILQSCTRGRGEGGGIKLR